MSVAETAMNFIAASIREGRTVYVSTLTRRTKITPAIVKKWARAGRKLFIIDSEGNLRLAYGKTYAIVATPQVCLVDIQAA
jgi:hypothetical protein